MTMHENRFDALFVINQNADFSSINAICLKNGLNKIFFLTTQSLFDDELELISNSFPKMPFIRSFSDFVCDSIMESCDEKAYIQLLDHYCDSDVQRDDYFTRFMTSSSAEKNRVVCNSLISAYEFKRVYFSEGLGIARDVWESIGAKRLTTRIIPRISLFGYVQKFVSLFSKQKLYFIKGKSESYLFLAPTTRLRLESPPELIYFIPALWMLRALSLLKRENTFIAFLSHFESLQGAPVKIATTIHAYQGWMSRIGKKLHVFVDGHHPSNYPRTYIDGYVNSIFISRNMFDRNWFAKFDKPVAEPFDFISPEYFSEISSPVKPRTIILLLNHAGDWSALINRSDTDILVKMFVECARFFSGIYFVIRPHPTMIHPSHEGIHSIARLNRYVNWLALDNLELSSVTLEEDLARGDFFVSEYSQTLLDVYRLGKPAVIANFTGRRSFMIDYEKIGFASVETLSGLLDVISGLIDDSTVFARAQNIAVRSYNSRLEAFYSGAS